MEKAKWRVVAKHSVSPEAGAWRVTEPGEQDSPGHTVSPEAQVTLLGCTVHLPR